MKRRVYVFSERAPFGCDLAGLLHPEVDLDALGWETDLEQAIQRIQKIQPPVVIVADEDAAATCESCVARIRAECPRIQIAEVNLATGVVRIHSGEEQIVRELKDLLTAVAGRDARAARV